MMLSQRARQLEKSGHYSSAYQAYEQLYSETGLRAYSLAIKRLSARLAKGRTIHDSLQRLGINSFYALSLANQLEKRLLLRREMHRAEVSIPIKIVNAVHGRTDANAINAYLKFLGREPGSSRFSSHISNKTQKDMKSYTSVNAYGYFMTMRNILRDALTNKYSKIAVFDDDVFFCDHASNKLANLVDNSLVPDDWKVLLLGASEYGSSFPEQDSELTSFYHASPGETCGSFAVCYDRSIFDLLLSAIDIADGTFDNNALGHIYDMYPGKCFVLYPNICIANVQSSDIRSGRDQGSHSKKMRWQYSESRYKDYLLPHALHVIFPDRPSARNAAKSIQPSNLMSFVPFYVSLDGVRPIHRINVPDTNENIGECNELFTNYLQVKSNPSSARSSSVLTSYWNTYREEFSLTRLTDLGFLHSSCAVAENSRGFYGTLPSIRRVSCQGLCSVIIPVARPSDIYLNALESVCNQSYEKIEIVIVIDNPEIDRDTVLKSASDLFNSVNRTHYSFQVIKHSKRRYACAARNTGFFASSGEYISFLDEDDIYLEDRIRSCIAELQDEGKQEFDACYCGYKGNWNGVYDEDRFKEGVLFNEIITLSYKSHYICTNTITFRASALEFLGGFNESYVRHQDIELMLRFFKTFKTTSVKYIGAHNCPSPREDTFLPSLVPILNLKRHLICDFIDDIVELTAEDLQKFIEGHARDVARHLPMVPNEDRLKLSSSLIRALLPHDP